MGLLQEFATKYQSMIDKLTPEYIAGFFDGEGCVNARFVNSSMNPSIRVSITQKRADILLAIYVKFPERCFSGLTHKLKNGKGTTKCYCLTFNSSNAKNFLECISPFVVVKKEQVDLALKYLDAPRRTTMKTEIARQIKAINRKNHEYILGENISDDKKIGGVQ